jgi:hypothetical protein
MNKEEQNTTDSVEQPQQQAINTSNDVETVDVQIIQIEAISQHAKKMFETLNEIIECRNAEIVRDVDKEFLSKVAERREFYNKIDDICFSCLKPYLVEMCDTSIDTKNRSTSYMVERLMKNDKGDKFITDEQSFSTLETANMQLLAANLAVNKVKTTVIKAPKVLFTSLNLL